MNSFMIHFETARRNLQLK